MNSNEGSYLKPILLTFIMLIAMIVNVKADCYCTLKDSSDQVNRFDLIFQGKLKEVKKLDSTKAEWVDDSTFLMTFEVDTILKGRSGKQVSITWKDKFHEPCFSKKKAFKIGDMYHIGINRSWGAAPPEIERRKRLLYPNDYIKAKPMYPWFDECSLVKEMESNNQKNN